MMAFLLLSAAFVLGVVIGALAAFGAYGVYYLRWKNDF